MRAPARAMLLAGLALCCGQALAQPPPAAQPRYSADGLYNLANSYARAGRPGLAVLSYERALLLAPGDADIRANLEYVRAQARVPVERPGLVARMVLAPSPTGAAWLGVLGIALVGTAVLAGGLAPRLRWVRPGGALLGIILLALAMSHAALLWPRMREAVALIDKAPARVSPAPLGETTFALRQAETVTVTAEHEDFLLVRTRAGLSGWVSRADLGVVLPHTRMNDRP